MSSSVITPILFILASAALAGAPVKAKADGLVVDKVYHPYVDALEKEIEYRGVFQERQEALEGPAQLHKLSFGGAIGQRWFAEAYVVAERSNSGNFDIEGYELELKWQLTEQGEYSADWGLVFEYEKEQDIEEFSVGILTEREWGRWSGALNLFLIEEWGKGIEDEFESSVAAQVRYRYSPQFEPALELYSGQDFTGIGPVVMGKVNLGVRKSLGWEAGLIFGVDSDSTDQTFRFLLEYEF